MHVYRIIGARSCSGKATCIRQSECECVCVCVCVALVFQHATRMRHIVICGLPRSTLFFHLTSRKARFSKNVTEHKNVFSFSLHLLSVTFLILRGNERYMIKNVYRSSCKVPFTVVRF